MQFTTHNCTQGMTPEAYRLRAWIHDYMGNHEETERNRQLAK